MFCTLKHILSVLPAYKISWTSNDINTMHSDALKAFDQGWVAPTPNDIHELKAHTNLSTNELAAHADIKPKHLRGYLSEKNYVKGKSLSYSLWRLWLEDFGCVQPVSLEVQRPFLRSEIFSHQASNWLAPKVGELKTIQRRSGVATETIARFLNIEATTLSYYLSHSDSRKVADMITHENWIACLRKIQLQTLTAYKAPPTFPDACLKSASDGFEPPSPKVLRQFVAWTGMSAKKLENLFGFDSGRLSFFMSNRSARTQDASINTAVFSFEHWQAPSFIELRTFCNILSLNPYEVASRLKLSQAEIKALLNSQDNLPIKKSPLPVKRDDWFALLDAQRIVSSKAITRLTKREERAHYIHYSSWRLMLYAFGILSPQCSQPI